MSLCCLSVSSSWSCPTSRLAEGSGTYPIDLGSVKALVCALLDWQLQGSLTLCRCYSWICSSCPPLWALCSWPLLLLHYELLGRFSLCEHFSTHWLPLLMLFFLFLLVCGVVAPYVTALCHCHCYPAVTPQSSCPDKLQRPMTSGCVYSNCVTFSGPVSFLVPFPPGKDGRRRMKQLIEIKVSLLKPAQGNHRSPRTGAENSNVCHFV